MKLKRFCNGCDTAIFYFACGMIYFLPISTGLTEWGSGLILMTFLVKRTVLLVSRLSTPADSSPQPRWKQNLKILAMAYSPAGGYLNRPLAFFVLACILATIFSQDFGLSLQGLIFKWFEGVLVYCGFMEGIKAKKQLRILAVIFFISAGLVGINGLFQSWQGEGFIRGRLLPPDERICSTLKHSNDYAGYLLMALPLSLAAFFLGYLPAARRRFQSATTSKKQKWLAGAVGMIFAGLISVLFWNLGLTYSRGGWAGMGLALLILARYRRRFLIPGLVMVLILGLYFLPKMREIRNIKLGKGEVPEVSQGTDYKQTLGERLNMFFDHYTGGWMGRSGYWREALHMISDYPLVGAGLNTYSKLGDHYKINWGGYPHNCFLHMTAETGLIGFSAFIWLLFVFFRNSFRHVKRMTNPFLEYLLLGYLSGFSGFVLQSFVDTNIYSVQLGALFWLLLAMIVKIQQIEVQTP